MRAHRAPRRLHALILKYVLAVEGRDGLVDQGEVDRELNLLADAENLRQDGRLLVLRVLLLVRLGLAQQAATLGGQRRGVLDAGRGRRGAPLRRVELLVDAALGDAGADPKVGHALGVGRRGVVEAKLGRNVNVVLGDAGAPVQPQTQRLVQDVDVPEEDALETNVLGRLVQRRAGALEAGGDA